MHIYKAQVIADAKNISPANWHHTQFCTGVNRIVAKVITISNSATYEDIIMMERTCVSKKFGNSVAICLQKER